MTDQEIQELKEKAESAKYELKSLKPKSEQIAINRATDYFLYIQSMYKTEKRIKAIYNKADAIKKDLETLKERNLKNENNI